MSAGWLALGWVASLAAAGWFAFSAGQDAEIASRAEEDAVASRAAAVAAHRVAVELGKIDVKHVTIRQELEREVQTHVVYRDCKSGPDARRLLNDTIGATGRQPGGVDSGELPASGAAGG